jgi:hypothetical protein
MRRVAGAAVVANALRSGGIALSCALVALAVSLAGVPSAFAASDGADRELDAVVLGEVRSPALKALDSVSDLDLVRLGEIDRLRPARYDLLLVDGHHLKPEELETSPTIEKFVSAGKWIAAFDLVPTDHEALRAYTGFDVADRERSDRSELFAFRVSMVEGTPLVEMINTGPDPPPGSARLDEQREAKLSRGHLRRVARLTKRQIASGPEAAAAGVPAFKKLACDPLQPAPDPELQHVGYCYWDAGTAATRNGYWTERANPWWLEWSESSHAPGRQTATWTFMHRFDVFLNNDAAHPHGNFQTVYYTLDGQFSPKKSTESFFRMDRRSDKIKYLFSSLFPERAWWTAEIAPSVTPTSTTSDHLLWQSSQPESPNAETHYSSGEEFNVSFTGSGTAGNLQNVANVGAGLTFGYTTSKSKSWAITDWGVANKGSGNRLHWVFNARQPCDTANASRIKGCFEGAAGTLQPGMPKPRSLEQTQVHASGRWRTRSHLSGRDAVLTFHLQTPVTLMDTYCKPQLVKAGLFPVPDACAIPTHQTQRVVDDDYVTVDAALVNPIPIKALTLSPNPANGSLAEKVTGTVTLERSTPLPVTVKLFSNSANAVLPSPLPGVSNGTQGTVTIDPGKTSATFAISTNNNKLPPGGRTTANITASHVLATNVQLQVTGN